MAGKYQTLRLRTKIIIYTEMISIIAFFILTIIEISLTLNMNSVHQMSENKFFLFFMNKRLVQEKYLAYADHLPKNQKCPDGYKKMNFLTLKTINNVTLTDITDRIKIAKMYYNDEKNKFNNNTFEGNKYYTFDLQEKGNEKLTLLHDYVFYTLGGYNLCTMDFYFNSEYNALNVITVEKECKDVFPQYHTADCGQYANNTYRLCVITEFLSFENGTLISESNLHGNDEICPYNEIKINIVDNPNYNLDNPDIPRYSVEFVQTYLNNSTDPLIFDNNFFTNFSPFAYLGDHYYFSQPDENFVYFNPDNITTYTIGEKYGYTLESSNLIHSEDFVEYYKETFLSKNVFYINDEGEEVLFPSPLGDYNDPKKFYFPIDSKNTTDEALKISFSSVPFQIISAECFTEIFYKNNITEIMGFLNKLTLNFYPEISSTLLAWLFAKLFISVYCYGKIRFFILKDKKNLKLSLADQKSELITKYTFKVASLIVFVILFTALEINQNNLDTINHWIEDIIHYKCFSESMSIIIGAYGKFTGSLRSENNSILILVFNSVFIEALQVCLYIYHDLTDNNSIIVDNEHNKEDFLMKKTN